MKKFPIFWMLALSAAITAAGLYVFHRFPMMPLAASAEAAGVDGAFNHILYLVVPIYALVVAFLAIAFFRFRQKNGACAEGVRFSRSRGYWVETTWIALSLVLCLGLAAYGSQELIKILGKPEAELDVEVRASQWSWEFFYPAYNQYGAGLLLPRGKRVRLILTSQDVVHSFWVPEFRLRQDAVPGKVIPMLFTPTIDGEYTLLCSQLCGRDHTIMTATVKVMEPQEFESELKQAWGGEEKEHG